MLQQASPDNLLAPDLALLCSYMEYKLTHEGGGCDQQAANEGVWPWGGTYWGWCLVKCGWCTACPVGCGWGNSCPVQCGSCPVGCSWGNSCPVEYSWGTGCPVGCSWSAWNENNNHSDKVSCSYVWSLTSTDSGVYSPGDFTTQRPKFSWLVWTL